MNLAQKFVSVLLLLFVLEFKGAVAPKNGPPSPGRTSPAPDGIPRDGDSDEQKKVVAAFNVYDDPVTDDLVPGIPADPSSWHPTEAQTHKLKEIVMGRTWEMAKALPEFNELSKEVKDALLALAMVKLMSLRGAVLYNSKEKVWKSTGLKKGACIRPTTIFEKIKATKGSEQINNNNHQMELIHKLGECIPEALRNDEPAFKATIALIGATILVGHTKELFLKQGEDKAAELRELYKEDIGKAVQLHQQYETLLKHLESKHNAHGFVVENFMKELEQVDNGAHVLLKANALKLPGLPETPFNNPRVQN